MVELGKFVESGSQDQNTGVEYVWPSYVRSGCKLVWKLEKMVYGADWEDVGVEKDDFGKLDKAENMKLCKDRSEVRAT